MFTTFLRRELAGRRRQTVVIALGTAVAIALVILVQSVSAGVRDAQASVLDGVYGIGTDLTVTAPAAAPGEGGGPGRFEFGADAGASADGSTTLSTSRLHLGFGTAAFDDDAVATVLDVDGVAGAAGYLQLSNTTFDGQLPDFAQLRTGGRGEDAPADGSGSESGSGSGSDTDSGSDPGAGDRRGGFDGAGGSAFDIATVSVIGLEPGAAAGPLSAAAVADGRAFAASDAGAHVAILDAAYATSADLGVGDTIELGGTEFEIVGTVTSTSADAATAANAYLPLDVAQDLSGETGEISAISVSAESAAGIDGIRSALEAQLPELTISTQAELAAAVTGSLGSAADLMSSLGRWLSIAALVAAFGIAILLTMQSVSRRTREFGTLKAIGWSNRRIVGQVAGESLVQGLIGGVAGLALGLAGILVIDLIGPALGGTIASSGGARGGFGGFGGFRGGEGGSGGLPGLPGGTGATGDGGVAGLGDALGALGGRGAATTEVVLHAPVPPAVIALAIGIAVLGALLAGAVGGWRAARLRPAEALRSIQ